MSSLVDNIVEVKETKKDVTLLCTACEFKTESSFYCTECKDYLCQTCQNAHVRVKLTKDHKIKSIVHNPVASIVRYVCPIHPLKELETYCNSCRTPTCSQCLPNHQDHQLITKIDLNSPTQQGQQMINKIDVNSNLKVFLDLAKDKQLEIERTKQSVEPIKKGVEIIYNKVIKEVYESVNAEINNLQEYQTQAVNHIQSLRYKKISELKQSEKNLDAFQQSVTHAIELSTYLLTENSKPGLLFIQDSLTEQLKYIIQEPCNLGSSSTHTDIHFVTGKSFVDMPWCSTTSSGSSTFLNHTPNAVSAGNNVSHYYV